MFLKILKKVPDFPGSQMQIVYGFSIYSSKVINLYLVTTCSHSSDPLALLHQAASLTDYDYVDNRLSYKFSESSEFRAFFETYIGQKLQHNH